MVVREIQLLRWEMNWQLYKGLTSPRSVANREIGLSPPVIYMIYCVHCRLINWDYSPLALFICFIVLIVIE